MITRNLMPSCKLQEAKWVVFSIWNTDVILSMHHTKYDAKHNANILNSLNHGEYNYIREVNWDKDAESLFKLS